MIGKETSTASLCHDAERAQRGGHVRSGAGIAVLVGSWVCCVEEGQKRNDSGLTITAWCDTRVRVPLGWGRRVGGGLY